MLLCRSYTAGCLALAVTALAGLACAGCEPTAHARLWADTALPDGGFSSLRHQRAYDGESVTFELECDPGLANYVVFGIAGDETVVSVPKAEGRYRWAHVFRCGNAPKTYEVYAVPYLMRGKCDYIYDKNEEKWYHYPGRTETPDVPTDREQRMQITCYRVEMKMRFAARGGAPKNVDLRLTKDGGEPTVIRRRFVAAGDAPGFLLTGPDAHGQCEVAYVPLASEIGRAGKTVAELVIEHANGSVERLRQNLDTP
ncbi:MAG: hypothetical protein NT049_12270 [Planctomycetota bacterium]|nr:hypothetical protein [Planctomycetota bacterium]